MRWVAASDATINGGVKHLDSWLGECDPDNRKSNARSLLLAAKRSPVKKLSANEADRLRAIEHFADHSWNNSELADALVAAQGYVYSSSLFDEDEFISNSLVVNDPRYGVARLAAMAGKDRVFKQLSAYVLARLTHWLNSPMVSSGGMTLPPMIRRSTPAHVPDLRKLLPKASAMKQPGKFVDFIAEDLKKLHDWRLITRGDYVANLCLLGQWCAENNQSALAKKLLAKSQKHATGLNAAQLWVADLARCVGYKNQAAQIELTLLKSSCLPIARIENLLDEIEANQGRAQADKLAASIAEYSSLPAVLIRAIRHTKKSGDKKHLTVLETRLQDVTP